MAQILVIAYLVLRQDLFAKMLSTVPQEDLILTACPLGSSAMGIFSYI
jgi:hypothetical protein